MTLRPPAFYKLVTGNGRIVFKTHIAPLATVQKRVIHIYKYVCAVRLRISKSENTAAHARSHLRLYIFVHNIHGIVIRRSPFSVVRITKPISLCMILMRAGFKKQLSNSGTKQEIAQIGNSRSTQMCETKAKYGQMIVFITRRCIIIIEIGIGAHLNATKRNL